MEHLYGGLTLELCEGAFPLSTDSIALAGFTRLSKDARVLDLGSGCGTLGLLLCANDPGCTVTGIEIDEKAHQMALQNIRRNGLERRLSSICGDLTAVPANLAPGSFSCAISNPPYFSGGFQSRTLASARQENLCTLPQLFSSAAWAVQYGGDFYLVHKPERLAEICACAAAVKLEPKRLCLLRHRADGPVTLILLQCRKGGKPGLKWEEMCLLDRHGQPTEDYRKLYHL